MTTSLREFLKNERKSSLRAPNGVQSALSKLDKKPEVKEVEVVVEQPRPKKWKFKVTRDYNGLITEVTAEAVE